MARSMALRNVMKYKAPKKVVLKPTAKLKGGK